MNLKFEKNKIKQFFLLFISIILLFLITYPVYYTNNIKNAKNSLNIDLINRKKISPKELFLVCYTNIKNNYYLSDLNRQNWSHWKKRYYHKIKTLDDAKVAIDTMLASLNDPYSRFMDEKEFLEQNNAINSKSYGIGVNITLNSGKTTITNVIEGTPAYNAGVLAGDIILKVNNVSIQGKNLIDVVQLIKKDSGKFLELELLRGDKKLNKIVKKEEIKVKTVDYKKIDNNIGYIRISSFIGADTPRDFIIALNRLKDSRGLILDLRGNSGGLFQNAVLISDLFMEKGTIVSVVARKNKKNTYNANSEGYIYKNPLVVLVDEDTASASEIVSSALKDNHRAYLIGTRTYGKGLVQKIYPLPDKTGLNLTIARYLTPKGTDINKKGIDPDYRVHLTKNDFINHTDSQLNFAKRHLESELKTN